MATAQSRYAQSLKPPALDVGGFLSRLQTNAIGSAEIDALRAAGGEVAYPHRAVIGWGSLSRRDLTAAGSGTYLQETTTTPAEIALRPLSAVIASGPRVVQTRPGLLMPKVATPVTAEWLTDEADALTETQPVLLPLTLTPRWLGSYVQVSRQLLLQGAAASEAVSAELLAAVATAMDRGFLQGTGASGEPTGLINVAGIGTASGSSVDYAKINTAIETVITAGGRLASLGFITTPAVATLLKARARISGGRAILDDGLIDTIPVRVTTSCPSATILLADWSRVTVAAFGNGVRVESDPYSSGFSAGVVGMRILTAVDIAPMYASMVYTLTSVS